MKTTTPFKGFTGILLFLVLNLVFPLSTLAEPSDTPRRFRPGYYITLENDTVQGLLEHSTRRPAYFQARYLADHGEPIQVFGPREIKEYGFGTEMIYRSQAIDLSVFLEHINFDLNQLETSEELLALLQHFYILANDPEIDIEAVIRRVDGEPVTVQPMFLRLLLDGELSLYIFDHMLFAQKNDEPVVLLRQFERERIIDDRVTRTLHREYLGVLSLLTADCPAAHSKAIRTHFSIPAITNLFIFYNQCVGQPYWMVDNRPPWIQINPGFSLFSGVSNIRFQTNPVVYKEPSHISQSISTFTPGIVFDIFFPWSGRLISLSSGFLYYTATFKELTYFDDSGLTFDREDFIIIEQAYFKIPLNVHFSPWERNWRPSFFVGSTMNLNLKDDHKFTTLMTNRDIGIINTIERSNFHGTRDLILSFQTGADVRRNLGNRGYLLAGLRYETGFNIFRVPLAQHNQVPITGKSRLGFFSLQIAYMFDISD